MKPRVVSGMRPTGKLHLGHLVGALGKWVELQADYDCMYFVADWHALTSELISRLSHLQNWSGRTLDVAVEKQSDLTKEIGG